QHHSLRRRRPDGRATGLHHLPGRHGTPMKWTVTISDPLNETVLATVENGIHTDTGEVAIRTFDPPVVTPPGASKVLNLYVKQSVLEIPPRAIIQFSLDGVPVVCVPAVVLPPAGGRGAPPP